MPYDIIKKEDGKYHVIKQGDGDVPGGEHETRAEAEAHMKALYVNVPDAHRTPGMRHGGTMKLDDSYQPTPITEIFVDGRKRLVR